MNGDAMSETTTPNDDQGANSDGSPSLRVLAQYLKDLSFESPKAPAIFATLQGAPSISVNVDVGARTIGQDQYEVELSVACKSMHENGPIFVAEITYAGAFEIKNIPAEQMELVLLVECPRLLFPFLRQALADTTQSGNFPPVMLDPVDFLAIYEQNRARNGSAPSIAQNP